VNDAVERKKQFGAFYKGVLARVCVCLWAYRAVQPNYYLSCEGISSYTPTMHPIISEKDYFTLLK